VPSVTAGSSSSATVLGVGHSSPHARRFDAVELAIHSSGLINRENTDMIVDWMLYVDIVCY
jgi:hypothetical protein